MDRPPEHAVYACRGQSVYKTIVVKKEKYFFYFFGICEVKS